MNALDASIGDIVPDGWLIQSNPSNGQIIISMAGAYPLNGIGSLVTIPFIVNTNALPGDITSIHFTNMQFNEGNVPAVTHDGLLTVIYSSVQIQIPDTSAAIDETLDIPINVSDVTGLGIISADITLTFNGNILTAQNASIGEVVPNGWFIQSNLTNDQIVISMAGANPLNGFGSLVIIPFIVNSTAPNGDTTMIHIANLQFNEGGVPVSLHDGLFVVELDPPVLIFPSEDLLTNNNILTFDWTEANGADFYHLQVATDSSFSLLAIDDSTLTSSNYTTSTPLGDGKYFWHTRAGNEFIWSEWNIFWMFRVDTIPPTQFNLICPTDSAWINTTNPLFQWQSSSDAGSGIMNYYIYIDDVVRDSTMDTTWIANYDIQEGYHEWYIVAYDNAGNSTQSCNSWNFGVDITLPPAPDLIAPDNGTFLNTNTPLLIWNSSTDNLSGIEYYQLQYSSFPNFNPSDTITINDTLTFIGPLDNLVYYWKVKAIDKAQNHSEWSTIWNFEIDTYPPLTPILISPTDGIWLNNSIVSFEWSVVRSKSAPVRYILQIDTTYSFLDPLVIDTTDANTYTLNLVENVYYWRVKAYDLAGNGSEFSEPWNFGVDITSPNIPTIDTCSHELNIWSCDPTIEISWICNDNGPSGINGYSWEWSQSSSTNPDSIIDGIGTNTTSDSLNDGNNWYFHIKAKDNADNWSESLHYGAFYIDCTEPEGMIIINNGDSITYSLIVSLNLFAEDNLSGIYKMRFSNNNSDWSEWENYSTTYENWDLSSFGGNINYGMKTVYAQFNDIIGNISEICSDDIEYFSFPPTSPDNVNIEITGNDVTIIWSPVTTNINGNPINVDGYVIYSSSSPDSEFVYLASTTDTTYTDLNAGELAKIFYQVTAYVGDMPTLLEIFADYPDIKLGELDRLIEKQKLRINRNKRFIQRK